MSETDNRDVLELINSTYIKGNIEILFSKEPNYLEAMHTTADIVQPVVGKINNKVEVLGARSLKKVYINGEEETLGYLSDLRISPKAKKMRALSKGFEFMKTLMNDKRAKLHIATIIEDNRQGKIALIWKNKSLHVPNFYDLGVINTYFIFPIFPKFCGKRIQIIKGSIDFLDKIVNFLNSEGRKKQFFPVYTKDYFLNLPNFSLNDFYIALEDEEIVGVMAKWEQTPFKQVVIKKYNGNWVWIKKLTGEFLPKENEPIKQFYLSFVAIKDNDNKIFEALLNRIYNYNKHYNYFSLVLHSKDRLNKSLKKYFNIKYKSRLYITEFLPDSEIKDLIDDRIPYLELASL